MGENRVFAAPTFTGPQDDMIYVKFLSYCQQKLAKHINRGLHVLLWSKVTNFKASVNENNKGTYLLMQSGRSTCPLPSASTRNLTRAMTTEIPEGP